MNNKDKLTLKISCLQEELLIGSLLGDGMLSKNLCERWNCSFIENHCLEQEEYIRFKGEIFNELLSDIKYNYIKIPDYIDAIKQKKAGDIKERIVLRTICHPYFTDMEKKWYRRDEHGCYVLDKNKRRIKIVPKNLEISPFSLAIWYLDDGTHCPSKRVCSLATHGFTCEEIIFLIEKLKDLSINANLNKDKGKYRINVRTESYLNFINIISPYIFHLKCMEYKIDLSNYKNPIKQAVPLSIINEIIRLKHTTDFSMKEIGEILKIGGQNVSQILRRTNNKNNSEKSNLKGVSWRGDINKWVATIYGVANKKSIYLGAFNSQEEAEIIVLKAQELKKNDINDFLIYKNLK